MTGTARRAKAWGSKLLHPWMIVGGLVFLGTILLILGYTALDGHTTTREVMRSAGTAILSGGVFSAVVKSLSLTGVIVDEFRTALDTHDFSADFTKALDRREANMTDVEARLLWDRNTVRIFSPWFTEPSKAMEALSPFIDSKDGTFYRNCEFSYTLDSFDDKTGVYKITETQSFEVCARDASMQVPIEFNWSDRDNPSHSISIESLKVDGKDHDYFTKNDSVSGRTTLSYKFNLAGKTSYKIARTAVRTQSIHAENYIRIVFQRLVTKLTVRLQGPALSQLDVKLLSVGTALEFKDELHSSAAGIRQMVHELPVCPRQGFMLVMTRLLPNGQTDIPRT